jgi:hypothetical protein
VPVGNLGQPPPDGAPRQALTQMGVVFGTPDYMAPEQALGQNVDGRADLYSLGILIFEMLTGVVPFAHTNPVMVLGMQVTAAPPTIASKAHARIPAEVEGIVARLLAKDAGERFEDAKQLAQAIAAASGVARTVVAHGLPPQRRRAAGTIKPALVVGGAFGVLGLLVGLVALLIGGSGAPKAASSASTGVQGTPVIPSAPPPPDPSVHRDLERAAMANGDVKTALAEASEWLKADPAAAAMDAKLAIDLRTIALGHNDPDTAEALLETMGSVGVDALYDLVYGYPPSPSTVKAKKALSVPAIASRASPTLAVTMELRAAGTCDKKKALFDRARDFGDIRTLASLREYQPNTGCGFLQAKDCWSCMHRDGSLAALVAALKQRTKSN